MGAPIAEVLAYGCSEEDVALLTGALRAGGPRLRVVDSATEFVKYAVSRRLLAMVLGVGPASISHLDMIPVIRAIKTDLPAIIIADDDSLELERSARQKDIFYYLIHPIDRSEVEAVLQDLLRHARG
jgi:DNA-binding NtrC family response regulator